MCGIVGFLSAGSANREFNLEMIARMTDALQHRGPDARGIWQSADGRINLGHRRLSILDLSPAGAQPMFTEDKRFVLIFNGEIYNFLELRRELQTQGRQFRGNSDTEVLLYALADWGVPTTLRRLNGMFAFGLVDNRERALWLARDRFGEKPLYYSWNSGVLLFGSELKSLAPHPSFSREMNRLAIPLYMRFSYVPYPHSIFRETWKLAPGHYVRIPIGMPPPPAEPYWMLAETIAQRDIGRWDAANPALIDQLDSVLRRAVGLRMVADVPLGAFLSGGIDSSTIVALMQAQSSRPVKTFTIGFKETAYNEANDAARVAHYLGTEHNELYISTRECIGVIERMPEIYDEPFADSSQIPTTLVSQFTREHVTVSLSGDAGDELFGGYNRYCWTGRIWPLLSDIPHPTRRWVARLIRHWSPAVWDHAFEITNSLLPSKFRVRGGGDKIHKLASAIGARTTDDLYRGFVSQMQQPDNILIESDEPAFLSEHLKAVPPSLSYIERMMFLDTVTYLPSDILCKVDRASMSCGLESRIPFLDIDVVSLAWNISLSSKIKDGVGKWPLRQVLKRYVPEQLFDRPKMGFGIPIGYWLRGPLRTWAEELLSEHRLTDGNVFNVKVVRHLWNEHLSGRRDHQHLLWNVLMFEAWRTRWI